MEFSETHSAFCFGKITFGKCRKSEEKFHQFYYKGEREEKINRVSQEFLDKFYPKIIRENALEFIEKIDKENTESYLITASLDIWVKPFAETMGMKFLATEARFENGIFTGHFKTRNNNGKEKVNRIQKEIEGKKYDKIIAFGDTSGDLPMLSLAHESHYRVFH